MAMQRIISFGAMFCVFAAVSLSAAESKGVPEAKGGDACKQGRAQYASGDVLKAVKTLGRCLEREPRNREAWIALANANLEAGRFQPAADAFAKAEAIKPGDDAFLTSYLSALEGAGMTDARIPVLRALAGKKDSDRKAAENLLAAVEASGPEKYPEEYLAALQWITESPGADLYQVEKLAAAYLKRGLMEKAEAEYRGLLVRDPDAADNWAGLGTALAASDVQAAAECYRKAAFYSNQADQRVAYQKEQQRLSAAPAAKTDANTSIAEDSKDKELLAAVAGPAPEPAKTTPVRPKPEASKPAQTFAPAVRAKPESSPALVAAAKPAPEAKPKPFDVKAYQDSIYKAELAKRLAVLHAERAAAAPAPAAPASAAPVAVAPAVSAPAPGSGSSAKDAEKKAKEDKEREEKLAREAVKKAKEDKLKQEELSRKQAEAEKERLAKEAKAKREALARIEKARQDSVARAAESRAKAEKLARERRERYDRAFGYYRDGKLDSSLIAFKAVLADSPYADAWYYTGRAHLAKGDNSKAIAHFEKAPRDKPDLDGLKGKAYMGLGKHKDALKAMESQYAKSGNDSLLQDLADLKRKNGDEAGAIAYLEKLAEKNPGMEKVQEQLAVHYRAKGDKAKATQRYSRVFIANTNHGEANYWLGMEAANAGDHARAVPFLEKAVTVLPTRADAWKTLAKADAALGRKDAAWEAYKKAFALAPADEEIARSRLALARESRPADLVKCYEDVLRLVPADADAAMGLAFARYGEGNWIAAEKNFRIACKVSKDARAWAFFGRTLLELKKPDEASLTLQKAIDLGDEDPALRLDLARIRMEKGDLDWAEALVKDLSKKSPADPEPFYFLGRIALKRRQSAVAEEFFRKSHQLKPGDGKYAEALARLYKDKEDWKGAVSVLGQADSKLTASGRLLYGDCLVRGGDPIKAQTVYTELYKQEPSAPLLSRRVDLLVGMGKADQGVELAGGAAGAGFKDATEVRFSMAKAQLALADEHVLKGDVDLAVDLMKQVVKADKHRPEYHYYLGLGYFIQNKFKKAVDEFMDALTYRVDYPDALYRKGLSLIKTEDIKDAENAFGELSQHANPIWKARGLYGLAMVFEAQGKPEAVQHHLERSVTAHPSPDALAFLSRVALTQAKAPEAHEMARKALTLDPSHEGATVAMAEALVGVKKQAEAMELARQGLRAKPLSCGLLVQSAKLNYAAGKLDSTLAAGATAIRLCPEEPMGYYYAGVATHGSNRPKEAKQYFKSFRKYGGDKKLVPEN